MLGLACDLVWGPKHLWGKAQAHCLARPPPRQGNRLSGCPAWHVELPSSQLSWPFLLWVSCISLASLSSQSWLLPSVGLTHNCTEVLLALNQSAPTQRPPAAQAPLYPPGPCLVQSNENLTDKHLPGGNTIWESFLEQANPTAYHKQQLNALRRSCRQIANTVPSTSVILRHCCLLVACSPVFWDQTAESPSAKNLSYAEQVPSSLQALCLKNPTLH